MKLRMFRREISMNMEFKKRSGSVLAIMLVSAMTEICLNATMAESNKAEIEKLAKEKVKGIYPEFINIVKNGANESTMTEFAKRNMDTTAISKRFCGTDNEKLVKTIIKFLIWRLKTEAIQSVKEYSLDDNMQAVSKSKIVEVKCKLNKKTSDPINMTIAFSTNGENLGKIREIKVLEIPLIESAKTPMKKYFESKGIKIDAIKDPNERAEKCCLGLEDFITTHKKGSK